jgi:hypothetical protein
MKKILLIFTLSIATISFGQDYKMAVGLKGSYPASGGLNAKFNLKNSNAFEASLGGGKNSMFITGLFEKNNFLGDGFNWYYGGGATFGAYSYTNAITNVRNTEGLGLLNGVLGIEYTFSKIPLNLAVDAGPSIEVFPDFGFGWGGGLAVRYAIK